MKRLTLLIAVALFNAGCVKPLTPTKPPVSASLSSSNMQERLAKPHSNTIVRAFLPTAEGDKKVAKEVAGAECTLRSDEISAQVTTPQAVVLPSFKQKAAFENRGVPGAIVVDCEYQGRTGRSLLTVQEKKVAVVQGAGIAGMLIGAAVSSAVASTTPWAYPDEAHVTLVQQ